MPTDKDRLMHRHVCLEILEVLETRGRDTGASLAETGRNRFGDTPHKCSYA